MRMSKNERGEQYCTVPLARSISKNVGAAILWRPYDVPFNPTDPDSHIALVVNEGVKMAYVREVNL